jgi:thymidine phosphorylase
VRSFCDTVDHFAENPSEDLMLELVDRAERNEFEDEDLAHLALRLAGSGETIPPVDNCITADIASTGGPSSLSTLLCPLYLKALGFAVPKLAVPGRPAGGIDVLAQVPNYRIELSPMEVGTLLQKSRYVHFLTSRSLAPLDAVLYEFRRTIDKVNVPGLAIASLLAKKKAAQVSLVGLDVRVAGHGNFGDSLSKASENAERFCRVASLVGCQALCFLSDNSSPYQPFLGRGEALAAIAQILSGRPDQWLSKHDDACYAMAHRLASLKPQRDPILRPDLTSIRSIFRENLELQGSSFDRFEEYVREVVSQHTLHVTTPQSGFVDVDLELLRTLIVRFQDLSAGAEKSFTDPCGIILRYPRGTYVQKGDLIATVRAKGQFTDEMFSGAVAALPVTYQPIRDVLFHEVSYG